MWDQIKNKALFCVFMRVHESSSDAQFVNKIAPSSFESDLLSKSVDPVNKTSLNASFINWTDPVQLKQFPTEGQHFQRRASVYMIFFVVINIYMILKWSYGFKRLGIQHTSHMDSFMIYFIIRKPDSPSPHMKKTVLKYLQKLVFCVLLTYMFEK